MSGYEVLTVSQVGVQPQRHMNEPLYTHAATVEPPMPPQRASNPWPCTCGAPSCYGRGGIWYCSPCWQAKVTP